MAEIFQVGKTVYLHVDGYLYYKHSIGKNNVKYWRCQNTPACSARGVTLTFGNRVTVRKGCQPEDHINHAPNREKVAALKIMANVKNDAIDYPEVPPIQVVRNHLHNVPSAALAELPDRQNIKKCVQRERLRDMPPNPQDIEDLREIPDKYTKTMAGDVFLQYDSFQDDDYNLGCGRILIFCTKHNLQTLAKSQIWYVDGTFKTSPVIFYQLFVIMGSVIQVKKGVQETFALPLVYALLENKEQEAYLKVFAVTKTLFEKFEIRFILPQTIMSDFELSIINAAKAVFGDIVNCCLFHLCQSAFRRVQSEGLQTRYNDENDRSIKEAMQMMCALAFVPAEKVPDYFDVLMDHIPQNFDVVADYFEVLKFK